MKITDKSLMLSSEKNVTIGGGIEARIIIQVFVGSTPDKDEYEFLDIVDVVFMGLKVEGGHTAWRKFVKQMKEMGVDVDSKVDEEYDRFVEEFKVSGLIDKYRTILGEI